MNTRKMTADERVRFQNLLTAALDGEISINDELELKRFISNFTECQLEWNKYKNLKEITMQLKFSQPPQEVWDRYWLNVYNRIERGVGWLLVSIGAMIILFYGGFKAVESIIADPTLEWFVKAGILLLLGGLVIVLVSVLREKLFTRKKDKYKEIQR